MREWFRPALVGAVLAVIGCGKTSDDPAPSAQGGSGGTPNVARGGEVGSGGAAGAATTAGRGGAQTGGVSAAGGGVGGSAAVIEPAHQTEQVDLLLMIDNSISMAQKQAILAASLPSFLDRLMKPTCVDGAGRDLGSRVRADGTCSQGEPEFPPVSDLHVGVVTSSLGAQGGSGVCQRPTDNDRAQLLPKIRPSAELPVDSNEHGFLTWNPATPTDALREAFADNVANLVDSAGQTGCGFESSLEAWYRFLIDPDPPTDVPTVTNAASTTQVVFPDDPADNPILVQRAAFLRPDSALVIVMLTDENDCSIIDRGQGFLVGMVGAPQDFHFPRSTSQCETNPNDPCCSSCATVARPGCPPPSEDASCQLTGGKLPALEDNISLRCFDQKRRFGFDFLFPLSRYLDGLTKTMVPSRRSKADGTPQQVRNPIFPADGRTPSMVLLSAIAGVPWQDLATQATLADPAAPLEYMTFQELEKSGRWSLILGREGDASTPPTAPEDKLMFETPSDRSTLFGPAPHPLVGEDAALSASTVTGRPNAINGHESNNPDNADLQYACIFPLLAPIDCSDESIPCDCREADSQYRRANCSGIMQTHGKAYPSIRPLRLLKAFGEATGNAFPASVCPKTTEGLGSDPAAGYGPALESVLRGLRGVLNAE